MKKLVSFLLALVLCGSITACAAEVPTSEMSPTQTAAIEQITPFIDIPTNADYAEAVAWCREQGLMSGVGGNRFAPEDALTRAMMVTVLYQAEGRPPVGDPTFDDVPAGKWFSAPVAWAAQQGIVSGYGNGKFGPEDPVTLEQMDMILKRYQGGHPVWIGDPALAMPSTRAQVAVALYEALHTEDKTGGKVLVAYFSCTNNTMAVAEKIEVATGGDLYPITPAVPYTSADLNYNTDCRANREQNDDAARPKMSGNIENWKDYDVVFLGYPIWWGKAPKIIHTFLESYDFAGKTVIPFCTSGSSPYHDSTIQSLVGSDTTWISGQRFSGNASQATVQSWVESLNLSGKEDPIVNQLNVTFNGHHYTATLAEGNATVEAFVQYIKDSGGSITISAHDYGGWEKVGDLGTSLGTADNVQTHTDAGDFVLYSGNQIVLFYGSNDWSYTLLGHLDGDLSSLKADLGSRDVDITYFIGK